MALQITIPKGTRDFGTAEMCKRNFIFDTIKSVFRKFGFAEIETPAMENLSTLLGKYGDEGDKLLFKILNSGDFVKDILPADIEAGNVTSISKSIAEKGLRYDLTVPFARYVVQHRNELTFPFKRFQIQPVWRADKPQKGRYREFYQCDVDIIGSKSMLNEVELLQIVDEVFCKLNIGVTIKINNRKILSGIADYIGEPDKFVAMTVAIDKLDKIGIDNVRKELKDKGLHDTSIDKLVPLLQHAGSNAETISLLRNILSISEIGMLGLSEAEAIFDYLSLLNMCQTVSLDLCLARGLNYYTGTIFEVKANDVAIGSICGGGRYDNLTGIFGLKDISGVGISFGADRIFDVMNQLNLFPNNADKTCDLMFVNFGHEEEKICLNLANKLRQQNVACEIYPDKTKLDKQFKYANNKKIKYVAIVGENEIANGTVTIKDMNSGTQLTVNQQDMPHYLN